jgi:hypothetical protein
MTMEPQKQAELDPVVQACLEAPGSMGNFRFENFKLALFR